MPTSLTTESFVKKAKEGERFFKKGWVIISTHRSVKEKIAEIMACSVSTIAG